jgi:hypothetical protein
MTAGFDHFAFNLKKKPHVSWFPEGLGIVSKWPDYRYIRFAHWLLTLLFLIPWAALLAWRVRRMKRLGLNIEHRTPNIDPSSEASAKGER